MAFNIKPSKMLNQSDVGNYVFAPSKNICNVQIFEEIAPDTCNEMIGNLAQIIAKLPYKKPIETVSTKIVSPYDVSPDVFVFDVAINSPGGDLDTYKSIATMFALAKSRGAIVRTNNIGMAASAASMLAVQGTPGYRVMSDTAYNFVHYGFQVSTGGREKELAIAVKHSKRNHNQVFSIYEKYTKITEKELKTYLSVENSGQLFAKECLRKNICDWVLTHDGQLIGRSR